MTSALQFASSDLNLPCDIRPVIGVHCVLIEQRTGLGVYEPKENCLKKNLKQILTNLCKCVQISENLESNYV